MLEHNLFPPTIIFEKVILSSKSSQTDDVTKRKKKKKTSGLSFGLFHENLNDCGWLLEIYIFTSMV